MPAKAKQSVKNIPACALRSSAGKPRLRFPGFSGVWEEKKLGEVGKIITGSTPPTSNRSYYGGKFMFVSPADIGNTRFVTRTKTTLTESGLNNGRKIGRNAVFFVCIGSTIGKIAQAGDQCITNQQINTIDSNANNVNDFIFYRLSHDAKRIRLLAGTQAVPQINKNDFSRIKLFFPERLEQQKIADFLSSVDEWLEIKKTQKKSLEAYKKGMMQKIFSQEIRFKDEKGKDFPEWEEKRLGEVFDIIAGRTKSVHITASGKNIIVDMGGISSDGKLIANKFTIYADDFLTTNDLVMPKDDIGGGFIIGKVAKIPINNKYICGDHIFKLTKLIGDTGFLFYAINSFGVSRSLRKKANGTAQFGLSRGSVENQMIPFPSLPEQQQIADFLTSLDNLIESKKQQIAQAQSWKKGLMQGLFV